MPRMVRLGRPANDNIRQAGPQARLILIAVVTALVMVVLYDWRLI